MTSTACAARLPREALAERPQTLWRYRELLPVRRPENVVSLGEVVTPLVSLPRIAARLAQGGEMLVKDEGRLPTGSFKARGLALAVSMAKELGVTHDGDADQRQCRRGDGRLLRARRHEGLRCSAPTTRRRSMSARSRCRAPQVFLVNGLIDDCGKLVAEGEKEVGWFNCSTLREPYRIEGKKTMGIELAEQLGWEVPDVIFYPTGGGTGIIGMWKAFAELEAIGWIGTKRPRMVVVQAAGCAPMVKAWEEGVEHAPRWQDAHTFAAGIRVPQAVGDFLILRAVRESGGFATAVDDDGDRRGLARGRRRGRAAAVPRGRGDLCRLQAGARRRPGQARRAGRAVQLRHRPQIPDAGSRHSPEARRDGRLEPDAPVAVRVAANFATFMLYGSGPGQSSRLRGSGNFG